MRSSELNYTYAFKAIYKFWNFFLLSVYFLRLFQFFVFFLCSSFLVLMKKFRMNPVHWIWKIYRIICLLKFNFLSMVRNSKDNKESDRLWIFHLWFIDIFSFFFCLFLLTKRVSHCVSFLFPMAGLLRCHHIIHIHASDIRKPHTFCKSTIFHETTRAGAFCFAVKWQNGRI